MPAGAQAMAARGIRGGRYAALHWRRSAAGLLLCITLIAATLVGIGFYCIYLDRTNLPDLEPFVRFDFPTIGHIYDTNGQPLMEMATEYRWISKYEDIPSLVTGAILAAEDKNFYSHNGVDYSSIPRVLGKLRIRVASVR
jgi:penicillin-binding protein 1A